jgi:hypothetical protein
LEVLPLGNKGLQGTLPFKLSMLSKLRKIDLSGSQFHGTIHADRIGSTELEALLLHDNGFTGVCVSDTGDGYITDCLSRLV